MDTFTITEADIYEALLCLGWIIPTTAEELELVEKHLAETGEILPAFPKELEDPAPLISRLRREQENGLNNDF